MTIHIRKFGQTFQVAEDVMNRLRLKMYEWDVDYLAEVAGVNSRTIYAIRSGRTLWPRGTTLFGILKAMNLAFVLIDLDTGDII